jgi:beta-phosphoglucomutase-like phosphatase (HAD superfamily)
VQAVTSVLRLTRNPTQVREMADKKHQIFNRLRRDREFIVLPGARQLVQSLKHNGVRTCSHTCLRYHHLKHVTLRSRDFVMIGSMMSFARPAVPVVPRLTLIPDACLQTPCAVVSALQGDVLRASLQRAGLSGFDAIISADDVSATRPEPDQYLMAAMDLQRPPLRCAVFAASNSATEAAHSVGMQSVAFAGRLKGYELQTADLVLDGLEGLKLQNLKQLFGEERGRESEFLKERIENGLQPAPRTLLVDEQRFPEHVH